MDITDWPRLTKIVQLSLNQTPTESLDGLTPLTVMTGLKPMNGLDTIAKPSVVNTDTITLTELHAIQKGLQDKARIALDNIHQCAVQSIKNKQKKGRQTKLKYPMAQYEIGDDVL